MSVQGLLEPNKFEIYADRIEGTTVKTDNLLVGEFQPLKGAILASNGGKFSHLSVGSDNEVLIADSAEPEGVRWGTASSVGGDVSGPAVSQDNAVSTFDGTTGKLIKDSGINLNSTVSGLSLGTGNTFVDGIAIGKDVICDSSNLCIGTSAQSLDPDSHAVGMNCQAQASSYASGTLALADNQSYCSGIDSSADLSSVCVGNNSSAQTSSVIVGNFSTSDSDGVVILCNNVNQGPSNNNSVIIKGDSAGENSVCVGSVSTAGTASVSVGPNNNALGQNSTCVGISNSCTEQSGISLGFGSVCNSTGSFAALNGLCNSDSDYSICLGDSVARAPYNVIIGDNCDTTASSDECAVILGSDSRVGGQNGICIGRASEIITGANDGICIGRDCTVSRDNGLAIGVNSVSSGLNSVCCGPSNSSTNTNSMCYGVNCDSTNVNSWVGGSNSSCGGQNALCLGTTSNSSGNFAICLGSASSATSTESISIGRGTSCAGAQAMSFGGASASLDHSICFGDGANVTVQGQFSANHMAVQSTCGPAGGGSPLPATPALYWRVRINNINYVLPLFLEA